MKLIQRCFKQIFPLKFSNVNISWLYVNGKRVFKSERVCFRIWVCCFFFYLSCCVRYIFQIILYITRWSLCKWFWIHAWWRNIYLSSSYCLSNSSKFLFFAFVDYYLTDQFYSFVIHSWSTVRWYVQYYLYKFYSNLLEISIIMSRYKIIRYIIQFRRRCVIK